MNVKELREILKDLPDDMQVTTSYDDVPDFTWELEFHKIETRTPVAVEPVVFTKVLVLYYTSASQTYDMTPDPEDG